MKWTRPTIRLLTASTVVFALALAQQAGGGSASGRPGYGWVSPSYLAEASKKVGEQVAYLNARLNASGDADELIKRLEGLGQTLPGPAKPAWASYVEQVRASKDGIRAIAAEAQKAIAEFLAVSAAAQEGGVARAKAGLQQAARLAGAVPGGARDKLVKAALRGGAACAKALADQIESVNEQMNRLGQQNLSAEAFALAVGPLREQKPALLALRERALELARDEAVLEGQRAQRRRILDSLGNAQKPSPRGGGYFSVSAPISQARAR